MRRSLLFIVLLAGTLVLGGLLGGCTAHSAQIASGDASSASPSPSAAPTLRDTQPSGTYSWRSTVLKVVPPHAVVDRTRGKGSWTFSETGCNAQACRGNISSSSGSTYGYTWNGRQLTVTRAADAGSQPCLSDATGKTVAGSSASYRRSYTSEPVDVPLTQGPPQSFVVDIVQHAKITKLVHCQDSGKSFHRLTLRLAVTHQG